MGTGRRGRWGRGVTAGAKGGGGLGEGVECTDCARSSARGGGYIDPAASPAQTWHIPHCNPVCEIGTNQESYLPVYKLPSCRGQCPLLTFKFIGCKSYGFLSSINVDAVFRE